MDKNPILIRIWFSKWKWFFGINFLDILYIFQKYFVSMLLENNKRLTGFSFYFFPGTWIKIFLKPNVPTTIVVGFLKLNLPTTIVVDCSILFLIDIERSGMEETKLDPSLWFVFLAFVHRWKRAWMRLDRLGELHEAELTAKNEAELWNDR